MKTNYHGYDVSTPEGQRDLAYGGRIDPNRQVSYSGKPQATPLDKLDLEIHGADELADMGRYGTLDRLHNSGLIKHPNNYGKIAR